MGLRKRQGVCKTEPQKNWVAETPWIMLCVLQIGETEIWRGLVTCPRSDRELGSSDLGETSLKEYEELYGNGGCNLSIIVSHHPQATSVGSGRCVLNTQRLWTKVHLQGCCTDQNACDSEEVAMLQVQNQGLSLAPLPNSGSDLASL